MKTELRTYECASWVEAGDSDKALDAAAPGLERALAEEEYQYGVTYIGVKHAMERVK